MTTTTAEQQDEWIALLDRMDDLRKSIDGAEGMVTHYMLKHIDPDERYPLHQYELAKDEARDVVRLRAELAALTEAFDAHPHTIEVRARRQDGALV